MTDRTPIPADVYDVLLQVTKLEHPMNGLGIVGAWLRDHAERQEPDPAAAEALSLATSMNHGSVVAGTHSAALVLRRLHQAGWHLVRDQ